MKFLAIESIHYFSEIPKERFSTVEHRDSRTLGIFESDMKFRHSVRLYSLCVALAASPLWPNTQSDSELPEIDSRCEIEQSVVLLETRTRIKCDEEMNACLEDRLSHHGESKTEAEQHCWYQPLSLDPSFIGTCPGYMAEMEAQENLSDESILDLVTLRFAFKRPKEISYGEEIFKYKDSVRSIRRLLNSDPQNSLVLRTLRHLSFYADDDVETLNLSLRLDEMDPDCPGNLRMTPGGLFRTTKVLVDNWLLGEGSGSELTDAEIRDLLLRVQYRLIQAYDLNIEQTEEELISLHWALESIDDPVLSRGFENFQQLANLVDLGLEDHAKNRRAILIDRFSIKFDIDSVHGRSQSLHLMCSNHALELGLLDHCVKLLRFFGQKDSSALSAPALDWTQAAVSLLNALTRDCSMDPYDWFYVPLYWNERRCIEEHHAVLSLEIAQLVGRFHDRATDPEFYILEAYLHLDENSDDRYLEALRLKSSMVRHAAPLTKRLHRVGKVKSAADILAGVSVDLREHLTESEAELFDRTVESTQNGEYKNWYESSVDFKGIRTWN